MDKSQIKQAARRLADAWLNRSDLREMPPPSLRPTSRQEAYAIQDEMARLIGLSVSAWKLGATSPAVRLMEGHSGPVVGRVFSSTFFQSPASLPADQFPGARIEAEFAFQYLEDLPPRSEPYDSAELRRKVVLHPALEVIGNRYSQKPKPKLSTFDEIADNGTGWGLVVGRPYEDWASVDLGNLAINLRVNDGSSAKNFLGNDRCVPFEVAVECANMLSERGIGLFKGQFVTTGSVTLPLPLPPGSVAHADFGILGELRVAMT
jgi:2-keto-4-pentenoate hydratase